MNSLFTMMKILLLQVSDPVVLHGAPKVLLKSNFFLSMVFFFFLLQSVKFSGKAARLFSHSKVRLAVLQNLPQFNISQKVQRGAENGGRLFYRTPSPWLRSVARVYVRECVSENKGWRVIFLFSISKIIYLTSPTLTRLNYRLKTHSKLKY